MYLEIIMLVCSLLVGILTTLCVFKVFLVVADKHNWRIKDKWDILIDHFRKRKILEYALETGCDVDGDVITYKGTRYVVILYSNIIERVRN